MLLPLVGLSVGGGWWWEMSLFTSTAYFLGSHFEFLSSTRTSPTSHVHWGSTSVLEYPVDCFGGVNGVFVERTLNGTGGMFTKFPN